MTTTQSIRPVTAHEQKQAIAALVLAFSNDPMMRWVYPEPQRYLQCFPELVRALGGRAFERGTAYCAGDFAATALWLPPGVAVDEEAFRALVQRTLPDRKQQTMFAILAQIEAYCPAGPHWYLPVIGVDPTRQVRGLGSALLVRALEQCDEERVPAYLESSNERNIPLYRRHGFEVLGTVQADDSPTLWPMLRNPR